MNRSMHALVIDVKAEDLPVEWRKRMKAKPDEIVRVTIARENHKQARMDTAKPNRTFGMWADREDVNDVADYIQRLRQSRNGMHR